MSVFVLISLAGGFQTAHAQTPSAGWLSVDVGHPVLAGSATSAGGVFTIDAGGIDIWDTADEFHYVFQEVTGDLDIRARVDSITAAHAWAKAGVMIRASLSDGAPHAFALVSAGRGAAFQRRVSDGGLSTHTEGPPAAAPQWVRLVRLGEEVIAYTSADGSDWEVMDRDTVALGSTVYVGLAVTSHNADLRTTARISGVVGVAWTRIDSRVIGMDETVFVGIATTSHNTSASTTAVIDHVEIARARARRGGTKAPAVAVTSPAAGATFTAPVTVGIKAAASDADGSIARVEFYADATLIGVRTSDPLETVWSNVPAGSYTLTAVAFDDRGLSTTSAGVQIKVVSSSQPPTVSLTSPLGGAVFTAPATLALAASAADADGRIVRVDFYTGTTVIASDTTAPYAVTWQNVPAGSYSLTAVATDDAGETTRSAAVSIVVTSPAPAPPRGVIFTASADHATLVTSYRLEVWAAGVSPGSSPPVASTDLGKPQPAANGDITVDLPAFFEALAPGNYTATVAAVGSAGMTRSTAVSFTR